MFNFIRNYQTFFKVAAFSPSKYAGCHCSVSLSVLSIASFLSHSIRCIISHLVLICSSLMTIDVEHLSYTYLPYLYLLWWSAWIFCLVFIGLFSYYSVLRVLYTIFWVEVLCQIYDLQTLFPVSGLYFNSLIVSFAEQKFVISMESNL